MSAEKERHRQAAYLYSIIQSAENSEDGGPEGPIQEAFDAGIMYAARALLDNWAEGNDWTTDLYEYADEIRERTVPGTRLPADDAIRAAGWVRLVDILDALREQRECDCRCREENLTREPSERTHMSGCAWWPDREYTRKQTAAFLADRFGPDREATDG